MPRVAVAVVVVLSTAALAKADGIRFLPDEAQIACRAILPQCFTRKAWHRLCLNDPAIAKVHGPACREAASVD